MQQGCSRVSSIVMGGCGTGRLVGEYWLGKRLLFSRHIAKAVALVFVNTNMAAAGGLVLALILARSWFGKADLTMALNGALAGLVSITAEPLAPTPIGATLIGAVGGLLVVLSIVSLDKLKVDDPVGAISVHGVVGMWGLLAVPIHNDDASPACRSLDCCRYSSGYS